MRVFSMIAVLSLMATGAFAMPQFWKNVWPHTDFDKTSIEFIEIMSGGPGKAELLRFEVPSFCELPPKALWQTLNP